MAAALNINLLLENINNMISELNLPGYYPLRLSSIIERLQEQYGDEVDLNDLVLQELNESSEYYSKLIQIKNILESLGLEGEFGNVINALQENMTNNLDMTILDILKEIQYIELNYRDSGEAQRHFSEKIGKAILDLEQGQTGKKRRNKCRSSKVGRYYLLRDKKGRFCSKRKKNRKL